VVQNEQPGGPASGQKLERSSAELDPIISKSLMIGVSASAIIIIIGFLLFVTSGRSGYAPGVFPVAIANVIGGVIQLRPFAIIDFGLFLLILTPVFRVAIGIVGFSLEHDANMVAATSYVLFMLILSFLLGKAGG
jgi:uncharacterized membrane protein